VAENRLLRDIAVKTSTSLNSRAVGKPEIIPLTVDDLVLRRSASNGINTRMRHTRDLTDGAWQTLDPLITRARKRRDGRERLEKPPVRPEGILWGLRAGAPWADLTDRYPSFQTCHRRFQQWVRAGVTHPNDGHGFQEPEHRLDSYKRQLAFLQMPSLHSADCESDVIILKVGMLKLSDSQIRAGKAFSCLVVVSLLFPSRCSLAQDRTASPINVQSCESSRLRSFAFCNYWIFSVIMMVAFAYSAA
jgi:hypothetical protein